MPLFFFLSDLASKRVTQYLLTLSIVSLVITQEKKKRKEISNYG